MQVKVRVILSSAKDLDKSGPLLKLASTQVLRATQDDTYLSILI